MAQQAPLEQGSALYELAQTVDLSKVPEKLVCKNCQNFLLNAYKTACCEGSLCENCNTAAAGGACPLCKHEPLISNASKALRGTARNYLKSNLANADANKPTDATSSLPSAETKDIAVSQNLGSVAEKPKDASDGQKQEQAESIQEVEQQLEPSVDIVQSIEEPEKTSRRPTMDSTSGNEPDDEDIEINVGPDYDLSHLPEPKRSPVDEENQWYGDQQYFQEPARKNSTKPPKQDPTSNNSFNFDNNMQNINQFPSPLEAQNQFQQFMQSAGGNAHVDMMNNNPQFAQMQNQFFQMMQMNPMMQNMMQMPGMQHMMQNMGMLQMPIGMNGTNQWGGNMMPFGNQNFPMMNNGASFNQSQQYQNFQNGDSRNYNRNNSFSGPGRGRGKGKRGRGNWTQYENYNNNYNSNIPYQNQTFQGNTNYQQGPYDNSQADQGNSANNDKEVDHHADDDEFAPGGQDEVQEALGDSYNKKPSVQPEEVKAEDVVTEDVKQEDYQEDPSTADVETIPLVDSPKQEPKEAYIPEAYREDLDFTPVPFSAPTGPSAKDVPYRARGHGRFPSRGRGSYQGPNGYPPRSPARPISQPLNVSPTTNQAPGVVGAPTGPRAMREKEAPPTKTLSRAESDVGFKIRGTATQAKPRDEAPRSATPRSTYDDYDDRDRDSRRHSKYPGKHGNLRNHDHTVDYDTERDRKRRKSRREDDYDMEDVEHSHSRSDSQDRDTSRRNGRSHRDKDKDKPKDKHASAPSKHKSSSRNYEDDYGEGDTNGHDREPTSRSKVKKSSSRNDDRDKDERRDRDYERAEKDKHRKRSRHDRDRDDGYEDADEEESRRRSRKHKKEHASDRSSRKDRDRDRDHADRDDTDLGMRITGRSHVSSHRNSQAATPIVPTQPDKDPHTLEREARNKERMLKEQQRRENAAKSSNKSGLSGGRTMSYKFEDELAVKPERSRHRR